MGIAGYRWPWIGAAAATAIVLVASSAASATTRAAADPSALTSAVASIAPQVRDLMARTGVPGVAIAVVHDGKTVYSEGFGVADVRTKAPVNADTVFQLASVSKPIGATVIARQVGAGALRWDSRVATSLPTFALKDPWVTSHLTVADLYSHRSGLPGHAGDDLEYLGFNRSQILNRLRYLPLAPFRASYNYTNYGVMLGAVAAAKASGIEWSALSKQAIYAPLGMDRTTSSYEEYVSLPNHSVGHERVDGTWRVTPEQFNDDAATAAGGVASSVNDMAKWEAMVLGNGSINGQQIVASSALTAALLPHNLATPVPSSADHAAGQYGYGFGVTVNALGHSLISHSGAFAQGAATFVGMIPASKLGIVVLTNGYPIGLAETVGMTFLDNAEVGAPSRDWWSAYSAAFADIVETVGALTGAARPTQGTSARPLAAYAGTYANPYFGKATVTAREGQLTLAMGPNGERKWKLEHWNGNTFVFKIGLPEVDPSSLSSVIFGRQGTTMRVEYFDANGLGTLQRVQ